MNPQFPQNPQYLQNPQNLQYQHNLQFPQNLQLPQNQHNPQYPQNLQNPPNPQYLQCTRHLFVRNIQRPRNFIVEVYPIRDVNMGHLYGVYAHYNPTSDTVHRNKLKLTFADWRDAWAVRCEFENTTVVGTTGVGIHLTAVIREEDIAESEQLRLQMEQLKIEKRPV